MSLSDERKQQLLKEYHEQVLELEKARSSGGPFWTAIEELTKDHEDIGMVFRNGNWTHQELLRLHKNFAEYVRKYETLMTSPLDLIMEPKTKSRRAEIELLKGQVGFLGHLGAGICRRARAVHQHIKVLHPHYVGKSQRSSEEEKQWVVQLLKKYKDRKGYLKKIAAAVGRTKSFVLDVKKAYFDGEERYGQMTEKCKRKVLKILQKLYPDHDLTCELITKVPWLAIGEKLGIPRKLLQIYYDYHPKKRDKNGKIYFDKNTKPPLRVIRKVVKHLAKIKPTHLDSIDWQPCFAMLHNYCGGTRSMKCLIRMLCISYGINFYKVELADALKKLYRRLKLQKKMEFQSIWDKVDKAEVEASLWHRNHWAICPDIAHYSHELPLPYRGYGEGKEVMKAEPLDPDLDEVW